MTNQNKVIAQAYLKQALQHKHSKVPIRGYTKFMESLSKAERDKILSDRETNKLIDKINMLWMFEKKGRK